jgi:hypothetical protein
VHARSVALGHKPAALLYEIRDPIQGQLTSAFESSALGRQTGDSFVGLLAQNDDLFQYSRYAFEEERHAETHPLGPLLELVRFLDEFVGDLPQSAWVDDSSKGS